MWDIIYFSNFMSIIFKYIFLTASRDFLFASILTLLSLNAFISYFFGNISLVEQKETAVELFAGSSKHLIIFGFIIFISFYIKRAKDNKEVQFILSKPISRTEFFLSIFLSKALLGLLVVGFFSLLNIILYRQNLLNIAVFGLSLFLEVGLITSFTLAVSMIVSSPVVSSLMSLGFYILSNTMGYILSFINSKSFDTNLNSVLQVLLVKVIKFISFFIPRLDLITKSDWIVYTLPSISKLSFLFTINLIFTLLFILIGIIDLMKKEL